MDERVILHVDMDAFFAAVEVVDNPKLKGKPVIVGGISERGVVSTCSYEARKYGVRSAMPVYMAKALCPMGVYIYPRMSRYKEISEKIFKVLHEITPYVEPLSIDEAYLDVTELQKDPISIAKYIKFNIKKLTGLTISVGISYNKFLAKLASDWNKPDGLKVITKDMIPKILLPLPISKIYGLGKKSTEKLNAIGVFTIDDLHKVPKELLLEFFGKYGEDIYKRIRGIDNRKVEILRERKSIGRETTLKHDTSDKKELESYIKDFCSSISRTLISKGLSGKTITLKIKTSSFENHTRNKTLPYYISKEEDILKEALEILYSMDFQEDIRLIGVSVSSLQEPKLQQLTLFNSDFS